MTSSFPLNSRNVTAKNVYLVLLMNFVWFEDIPDSDEIPELTGELLDGHFRFVKEDLSDAPSRVVLRNKVTAAFAATNKVTEILKEDKFKRVLEGVRKIGRALHYASAGIGVLVDVVMVFLPSESEPMLSQMRKGFEEVNTNLNQVKTQITSLSNAINWMFKKDDFDEYTRKIVTFSRKYNELINRYEPNTAAFDDKRKEITDYYDDFDSHEFLTFLIDAAFFQSYITFTDNDRGEFLNLTKVVFYYVMEASKNDMVYLRLKNETPRGRIVRESQFWEENFVKIQNQMTEIDERLKNGWREQAKSELDKMMSHVHLSYKEFSKHVETHLSKKYFWRDWFVATVEFVGYYDIGPWVHSVHGGSFITGYDFLLREPGKIVVVASVPKDDYFDSQEAESALNRNIIETCKCDWRCALRLVLGYTGEYCCEQDHIGAGIIGSKISYRGGINMKMIYPTRTHLKPIKDYAISSESHRLKQSRNIEMCRLKHNAIVFG